MTTMQCPLGHPPGPQAFCPICGRATVPVDEPAVDTPGAGDAPPSAPAGPAPGFPPPPPPPGPGGPGVPPPPAAPAGAGLGPGPGPGLSGPSGEPAAPSQPDYEPRPPAPGSAADEARRMFEQLSGGSTPEPERREPGPPASSWTPAAPSGPIPSQAPEPGPGGFPRRDVPSYTPPPGALLPGDARTASAEILPAEDEEPRGHRDRGAGGRSKLLPVLLLLAVLLVGGYFLNGLLGGDDEDDDGVVTPPRASASASAPAQQTYTAAQIAESLKDPHFKHGYDAGKQKAATGPVADPEATCREMGLAERTKGYPWGAHDRQGCLVGIRS